jgi:hypothetical protein
MPPDKGENMDRDKVSDTDMNPSGPQGVGESTTRRGEDVAKEEGREFESKGKKGADRPVGEMTDQPGAAPSKPIDEDMPNMPPADGGR